MKLINIELRDKIWNDVHDKIIEHTPYHGPVRKRIEKNFKWWINDDNLFRLEIHNLKNNIGNDLGETD